MSDVTVPAPQLAVPEAAPLKTSQEALTHALCGAQFGDLEFDVGKSVRWTQWFTDDVFITDINTGTQRYWIVNWTETFPEAYHTVTSVNWFAAPVEFRKEQFAGALREPNLMMEPNDWVIFIDAHEGFCIDTRPPLPNDVGIEPFRSYLYREIARAEAGGKDRLVLPYYAFLKHDDIVTVDYPTPAFADGSLGYTTAQGSLGTPYYVPHQGLTRIIKVSVLQDPSFNWATIDTPSAPTTGMNVSIISYAYAHWNELNIVPPATTVAPLTEANDDGWRMRKLISMVRPIPSLPYTTYKSAYLNAGVGYVSTPDPGAVPSEVTFVWKARSNPIPLTGPGDQHIASQDGTPDQGGEKRAWNVYRPAFGLDHWFWLQSPDQSGWGSDLVQHLVQQLAATGEVEHLAMTVAQAPVLSVRLYRPVDGVWTPVGPAQSQPGPIGMVDSPSPVRIGRGMNGAGGWTGEIYSVECRTGLDPAGGTVLWRFDAQDYSGSGTSYVDPRGRTWTLTNTAAIVRNDDPPGTPGPWAPADPESTDPLQPQPVTPSPSLAGLLVGLYDNVIRLNLRDGVYYEGDEMGNIPLTWDNNKQTWVPSVTNPTDWQEDHWVAPVS